MQLNDILEENSIKQISKKTKISEENIERLLEKRFDKLDKVKAIGFLSIIEREFGIKLDELKQEAAEYFAEHSTEDVRITVGRPIVSSKRGKSKWFLTVVFALLAYASWYFVTQFDKTHLNTLLPTTEDMTKMIQNVSTPAKELVIGNTIKDEPVAEKEQMQQTEVSEEADQKISTLQVASLNEAQMQSMPESAEASQASDEVPELNITAEIESEQNSTEAQAPVALTSISIVPVGKLWFGMTQKENQAKKQQVIATKQEFDVNGKSYLVATSTAPFSVVYGDEKKEFRDLKIHYLLLDAEGVRDISKEEYTQLGGWGW